MCVRAKPSPGILCHALQIDRPWRPSVGPEPKPDAPDGIAHAGVVTAASVARLADADLPTRFGTFRMAVFGVAGSPAEHPVLTYGDLSGGDLNGQSARLVRLHSVCLTGDALGSLRCDCGQQLQTALSRIAAEGRGVLLYLPQEGRGIGLTNKIRAYALQDAGLDTVDANTALGLPADARDYSAAAEILRVLGLRRIRLLTNNPTKIDALERLGISVVERVPLEMPANPENLDYLRTKAERMGHLIDVDDADGNPGWALRRRDEDRA